MMEFLWWLVIGLVAGALARFFVPGPQPMSILLTMVLGLVGSLVGGFISTMIFGYDAAEPGFHAAGLLMSTVGAVIVLALYIWGTRRRSLT